MFRLEYQRRQYRRLIEVRSAWLQARRPGRIEHILGGQLILERNLPGDAFTRHVVMGRRTKGVVVVADNARILIVGVANAGDQPKTAGEGIGALAKDRP